MALASADGTPDRFYSLSSQIEAERKDYYDQLEKQQRSTPEITGWLEWFLDCLGRAISSAETTLGKVLFKEQLWDKINQKPEKIEKKICRRGSSRCTRMKKAYYTTKSEKVTNRKREKISLPLGRQPKGFLVCRRYRWYERYFLQLIMVHQLIGQYQKGEKGLFVIDSGGYFILLRVQ